VAKSSETSKSIPQTIGYSNTWGPKPNKYRAVFSPISAATIHKISIPMAAA
jgi:hypothetical protein